MENLFQKFFRELPVTAIATSNYQKHTSSQPNMNKITCRNSLTIGHSLSSPKPLVPHINECGPFSLCSMVIVLEMGLLKSSPEWLPVMVLTFLVTPATSVELVRHPRQASPSFPKPPSSPLMTIAFLAKKDACKGAKSPEAHKNLTFEVLTVVATM
ncbi:hypothetical protein VNO77_19172 [Canavalia gladiata]|uniref:Uncharacterized protein n=1 Tax=Canavalia gladiata TaxID=3824 RepID=A0AAN9LS36_CANGL